jgi:cell division protein FtsB
VRRIAFFGALLLAGYYALFGGEYGAADVRATRAVADEARVELAALRAETVRLEARVNALENDPRTLETLAREELGMIRRGEILYRFAGPGAEVDSEGAGR